MLTMLLAISEVQIKNVSLLRRSFYLKFSAKEEEKIKFYELPHSSILCGVLYFKYFQKNFFSLLFHIAEGIKEKLFTFHFIKYGKMCLKIGFVFRTEGAEAYTWDKKKGERKEGRRKKKSFLKCISKAFHFQCSLFSPTDDLRVKNYIRVFSFGRIINFVLRKKERKLCEKV